MNELVGQELKIKTRKVIGVQMVAGILLALGAAFIYTPWHGLSLFYGTMISTLSSLWLSYGVSRAAADSGAARSGEIALYLGAALRFIMVLVLFVVGLSVLSLVAVATVVGFIVAQLAFVIAGTWREKKVES